MGSDPLVFSNASNAFIYLYSYISQEGVDYQNTKAIFNIGFYIENPLDYIISDKKRKWSEEYAEYEWQWYLSGNKSAIDISKKAKIWKNHMDKSGNVNSNYGWHWKKNNQLEYVINELKRDKYSRRAGFTIFDAKDHLQYKYDTPCTYFIQFYVINEKLNINVMMRSNDLWYGFCNDQYCWSKLLQCIANKLNMGIGMYYHFANNLHVYNSKLNKL